MAISSSLPRSREHDTNRMINTTLVLLDYLNRKINIVFYYKIVKSEKSKKMEKKN